MKMIIGNSFCSIIRTGVFLSVWLVSILVCKAASDTDLVILKAGNIKIHLPSIALGQVREGAKITFVADGKATIRVPTGEDDGRSYVAGRKAKPFKILAEECQFTIYQPHYSGGDTEKKMLKFWESSVKAIEGLKEGKPVILQFYQPEVDIRNSVVRRVSGFGYVHTAPTEK
ncbi:MAG TPA: hypothetical protein EYQ50_11065 [Verrucomicrobiales bacterium]|nr:hypothetical protein [Verrucomicrobiales bacterium]